MPLASPWRQCLSLSLLVWEVTWWDSLGSAPEEGWGGVNMSTLPESAGVRIQTRTVPLSPCTPSSMDEARARNKSLKVIGFVGEMISWQALMQYSGLSCVRDGARRETQPRTRHPTVQTEADMDMSHRSLLNESYQRCVCVCVCVH